MLYKRFFVVTGRGLSRTSPLNAFDSALVEAGIDQCNLVPVSSILPPDATQVQPAKIPEGSITHCVLARCNGNEGESIGAGIGWAFCEAEDGRRLGLVAEDHEKKSGEKELENILHEKLLEMASAREMKINGIKTATATIKQIPQEHYGTTIAALVFTD